MLLSVKIAEKVGYEIIIRIASILYPLGIFLSGFTSSFGAFAFFYLAFSLTSFSLSTLPILNCLFTHFTAHSGKVSALAFFFNGIAGTIFSAVAYAMINPDNLKATIPFREGEGE